MTGSGPRAASGGAAAGAALQGALAAENAAIFGYGVAGAYLAGARQAAATAYWNDHRLARDTLAALLRARGSQPAAAADAYRLPFGVRTGAEAVSLATFIEKGVAAAYLALVGTNDPELRTLGARAMADAAVRAAYWQGSAEAFPGMPPAALTTPRRRTSGLCPARAADPDVVAPVHRLDQGQIEPILAERAPAGRPRTLLRPVGVAAPADHERVCQSRSRAGSGSACSTVSRDTARVSAT